MQLHLTNLHLPADRRVTPLRQAATLQHRRRQPAKGATPQRSLRRMPQAYTDAATPAVAAPPKSSAQLRQRADALGVELVPLHKNFGVHVKGLDLTKPLSEEEQQFVLAAWKEHDLLLFRGQQISPEDQQRLLLLFPHDIDVIKKEKFGNRFFRPRVPAAPLLAVRGSHIDVEEHEGIPGEELAALKPQGPPFDKARIWHMDLSDHTTPPEVSAMYMVLAPNKGGKTLFASTVSAFENLDPATQEQVLKLRTVSSSGNDVMGKTRMKPDGTRRLDNIDESIELAKKAGTHVERPPNPLVIRDPETGKRSFLFSVQRMHHFEPGMSREDSLDLLERLTRDMTQDSEMYALDWQPNDFAIWANRRILHSASPTDEYDGSARLFHLVFLDCKTPLYAAQE